VPVRTRAESTPFSIAVRMSVSRESPTNMTAPRHAERNGADVAGASPFPVRMWEDQAESRCRCEQGCARPRAALSVCLRCRRLPHGSAAHRTAAAVVRPTRHCEQPPHLAAAAARLCRAAARGYCSVQRTIYTYHGRRGAPRRTADDARRRRKRSLDWRTTRRVVRNAQRGVGYNTNGGSTMAANDARYQPYNGRHNAPAACNHETSAPRAAFDGRVRSVESSSAAHYMADMTGPLVRHAEHARIRLSHVVRADLAHVGEQVDGRHRAAELVLHSPTAPARSYNGYIPAATAT
jgi:hypothetical protein